MKIEAVQCVTIKGSRGVEGHNNFARLPKLAFKNQMPVEDRFV